MGQNDDDSRCLQFGHKAAGRKEDRLRHFDEHVPPAVGQGQ